MDDPFVENRPTRRRFVSYDDLSDSERDVMVKSLHKKLRDYPSKMCGREMLAMARCMREATHIMTPQMEPHCLQEQITYDSCKEWYDDDNKRPFISEVIFNFVKTYAQDGYAFLKWASEESVTAAKETYYSFRNK